MADHRSYSISFGESLRGKHDWSLLVPTLFPEWVWCLFFWASERAWRLLPKKNKIHLHRAVYLPECKVPISRLRPEYNYLRSIGQMQVGWDGARGWYKWRDVNGIESILGIFSYNRFGCGVVRSQAGLLLAEVLEAAAIAEPVRAENIKN